VGNEIEMTTDFHTLNSSTGSWRNATVFSVARLRPLHSSVKKTDPFIRIT